LIGRKRRVRRRRCAFIRRHCPAAQSEPAAKRIANRPGIRAAPWHSRSDRCVRLMWRRPYKPDAACRIIPHGSKTARSARRASRPDGAGESASDRAVDEVHGGITARPLVVWFKMPRLIRRHTVGGALMAMLVFVVLVAVLFGIAGFVLLLDWALHG
jgi:hypothetical protein